MKKIRVVIGIISVLFLGMMSVRADGKIYGISVFTNGNEESKNIHQEKTTMLNGKINIDSENKDMNNLTINNLGYANYISIENYSGLLGMTLNLNLIGNNTIEAFSWQGYSGSINISGSGSIKFKPASTLGTREVPGLINATIQMYYVDDVAAQKDMVASMIQTSLPITYVDGYVCINCKKEEIKSEETIKQDDNSSKPVDKEETKNDDTNKEDKKENVKKLVSSLGVEFISKDDMDSTYKLEVNDITANYSDIKLKDNQELLYVYDILVKSNQDKIVDMKNGEYTLKFKLSDRMKTYDNILVVYLKNKEIVETFETSKDLEYLSFKTNHLSEYGIIGVNEIKKVDNNLNTEEKINEIDEKNDLKFIIGGVIFTMIVFGGGLVIYFKNKSRSRN